jgi:hypothetical protein
LFFSCFDVDCSTLSHREESIVDVTRKSVVAGLSATALAAAAVFAFEPAASASAAAITNTQHVAVASAHTSDDTPTPMDCTPCFI